MQTFRKAPTALGPSWNWFEWTSLEINAARNKGVEEYITSNNLKGKTMRMWTWSNISSYQVVGYARQEILNQRQQRKLPRDVMLLQTLD